MLFRLRSWGVGKDLGFLNWCVVLLEGCRGYCVDLIGGFYFCQFGFVGSVHLGVSAVVVCLGGRWNLSAGIPIVVLLLWDGDKWSG